MKHLLPSTLLASALAFTSLQADWTVVSTFDDEAALDLVSDQTNQEGNAHSDIVDGKWAVFPGDLLELTSNLHAFLDLGVDLYAESVASGGPVTVYFEIIQPMIDGQKAINDTVWGLANIEPEEVFEEGNGYNSFNAMQRINAGNDAYEGRNLGTYEPVVGPDGGAAQFQAGETYQIWWVIDYNLGIYETYVQGGQWAEQTRLDTASTEGYWDFRTNPDPSVHTVDYFLVSLSRGNISDGEKGIDPTYFDNVAVDTDGENLSAPAVAGGSMGPGILSEFPLHEDGVSVNTGSWMGWVDTDRYPWVYSWEFNQWVYLDEASTSVERGVWGFIAR